MKLRYLGNSFTDFSSTDHPAKDRPQPFCQRIPGLGEEQVGCRSGAASNWLLALIFKFANIKDRTVDVAKDDLMTGKSLF